MLRGKKNEKGWRRKETGAVLCFSATSLSRGMTDRWVSHVKEAQWAAVRHSRTVPFSLHHSPCPVKNGLGDGHPFTTETWQRKQTQSRLAWGAGWTLLLISGLSVSQILLASPGFFCQKEQTSLSGEIKLLQKYTTFHVSKIQHGFN